MKLLGGIIVTKSNDSTFVRACNGSPSVSCVCAEVYPHMLPVRQVLICETISFPAHLRSILNSFKCKPMLSSTKTLRVKWFRRARDEWLVHI